MLATIGRLAIRLTFQNRLFADDYFLLFGCSSLIAAFTLTNVMLKDVYFFMSLILGPVNIEPQESATAGLEDRMLRYQQLAIPAEILFWVTIFAVKMSFLLFFRQLLDLLADLSRFWKGTVGLVIVSGIFFVAIPLSLLWRVKIRLQQKIILSTFLCLSVCMFAICLVRMMGFSIHGNTSAIVIDLARMRGMAIDRNTGATVDPQWTVFWQLVEASVAVTVVSLTAFRSLYNMKTQQEQKNKKRHELWLSSYRKRLISRKKMRRVDEFGDTVQDEHYSLPNIPGATLTGMRTFIGDMTTKSTQVLSTHGYLISLNEVHQEEEPGLIRFVNNFDMHQSV
ncbi:MAG: hypothetical protein Q9195_005937 [Heterodermia aff. obscurata]